MSIFSREKSTSPLETLEANRRKAAESNPATARGLLSKNAKERLSKMVGSNKATGVRLAIVLSALGSQGSAVKAAEAPPIVPHNPTEVSSSTPEVSSQDEYLAQLDAMLHNEVSTWADIQVVHDSSQDENGEYEPIGNEQELTINGSEGRVDIGISGMSLDVLDSGQSFMALFYLTQEDFNNNRAVAIELDLDTKSLKTDNPICNVIITSENHPELLRLFDNQGNYLGYTISAIGRDTEGNKYRYAGTDPGSDYQLGNSLYTIDETLAVPPFETSPATATAQPEASPNTASQSTAQPTNPPIVQRGDGSTTTQNSDTQPTTSQTGNESEVPGSTTQVNSSSQREVSPPISETHASATSGSLNPFSSEATSSPISTNSFNLPSQAGTEAATVANASQEVSSSTPPTTPDITSATSVENSASTPHIEASNSEDNKNTEAIIIGGILGISLLRAQEFIRARDERRRMVRRFMGSATVFVDPPQPDRPSAAIGTSIPSLAEGQYQPSEAIPAEGENAGFDLYCQKNKKKAAVLGLSEPDLRSFHWRNYRLKQVTSPESSSTSHTSASDIPTASPGAAESPTVEIVENPAIEVLSDEPLVTPSPVETVEPPTESDLIGLPAEETPSTTPTPATEETTAEAPAVAELDNLPNQLPIVEAAPLINTPETNSSTADIEQSVTNESGNHRNGYYDLYPGTDKIPSLKAYIVAKNRIFVDDRKFSDFVFDRFVGEYTTKYHTDLNPWSVYDGTVTQDNQANQSQPLPISAARAGMSAQQETSVIADAEPEVIPAIPDQVKATTEESQQPKVVIDSIAEDSTPLPQTDKNREDRAKRFAEQLDKRRKNIAARAQSGAINAIISNKREYSSNSPMYRWLNNNKYNGVNPDDQYADQIKAAIDLKLDDLKNNWNGSDWNTYSPEQRQKDLEDLAQGKIAQQIKQELMSSEEIAA